jgi:hypothetical protein
LRVVESVSGFEFGLAFLAGWDGPCGCVAALVGLYFQFFHQLLLKALKMYVLIFNTLAWNYQWIVQFSLSIA